MHRLLLLLVLLALVGACGAQFGGAARLAETWPSSAATPTPRPATLTVFAAVSLDNAMRSAAAAFRQGRPDVRFVFNLAGSQQLAQQIALGAPGDVFVSANQRQMDAVVSAGRVEPAGVIGIAGNRLVIAVSPYESGRVRSYEDLARPGLRLALAAEAVPAGQYALQALTLVAAQPAFGPLFRDRVLANVVTYEENVRAVLTKVVLGEADAGIVYASDVAGSRVPAVGIVSLPDCCNVAAQYVAAPLSDSKQHALARDFVAFLLSQTGQAVLASHGFGPAIE